MGLDFGFVQCEIWSLDLGLLDLGFFVWKRGQGVYIVYTDGFLLFSGQGGVNHFRPLKIFFGCFVGLDFGFVQCEIWSLDLGLLDFWIFLFGKGARGSTLFSLMGSCCFFRGKVG